MTRRALRRSGGFTLIELMVTLTILTLGLLALAQLMPAGGRSLARSGRLTSGTLAAAQKLEELKAQDWYSTNLVAGSYTDHVGRYSRAWTIENNVPVYDVKKVSVTATWVTAHGTRSSTVTTYLPHLGT